MGFQKFDGLTLQLQNSRLATIPESMYYCRDVIWARTEKSQHNFDE